MNQYNSIHLGTKIDEFDGRITALETLSASHTTQITNLNNIKVSNKVGTDLTGSIYIKDTNFDSTPSSDYYGKGYYMQPGSNNELVKAYMRDVYMSDGRKGAQLESRRTINGSNVYNTLDYFIDASGGRTVWVSEAAAWFKGLGVPKILRGTCAISDGQGSVSFSSAFNGAPTVVCVPWGTGTGDYSAHPGSITAGGCKFFGTQQTGSNAVAQANYSVYYLAVGKCP